MLLRDVFEMHFEYILQYVCFLFSLNRYDLLYWSALKDTPCNDLLEHTHEKARNLLGSSNWLRQDYLKEALGNPNTEEVLKDYNFTNLYDVAKAHEKFQSYFKINFNRIQIPIPSKKKQVETK